MLLDIDECAKSTHDCGRGQLCINRVGGYICQCPSGHVLNEQKECVDVDECTRFAGQVSICFSFTYRFHYIQVNFLFFFYIKIYVYDLHRVY